MKNSIYIATFILMLTAVQPTLAQNRVGEFLNVIDRLAERRAAPLTGKTEQPKIISADSSLAAPGDLDATFGAGGKVVTALPDDNFTQKMAIQPDGKIVVQGRSFTLEGGVTGNFLVRYNANGTLDAGFGTNGTVIIPISGPLFENFQDGLMIAADGKILISGNVINPSNGEADFAVFRFNADGSRDASFGANGVISAPVGDSDDYGYTLRVQPDGKIVVVGFVRKADPLISDVGIVRFNADGSVDTNFGTNGKLIIKITNANFALAFHFDVLTDGKLLLIGRTTDANIAPKNVFLARVNANGTLDASFGTNGILLPQFNRLDNYGRIFALQPDGKIVFSTGNYSGGVQQSSTVVRLNPNGSPDVSFGNNGTTVISASEGSFDRTVVIQPNGKILAARKTIRAAPFRFAVLRLNADGSRDTTFGTDGIMTTLLAAYESLISEIALQPDGKLVAAGDAGSAATAEYDVGLARYNLTAPRAVPFDFDGDGRADVSVFRQGIWYRLSSLDNSFYGAQFGAVTDKITPADFDGDARFDLAVFRSGVWYILNSATNAFRAVQFGQAGDVPLPGDYDGDGKADVAVFRSGNWFIQNSSNNSFRSEQFGVGSDKPIVGDFDVDGKQDLAVWRDGTWYVNRSTAGFYAVQFGAASDKPVAADYDGDGKTDVAVFRPSTGTWFTSLNAATNYGAVQFGANGDTPVPADYDGDGRADCAVYRGGIWFVLNSGNSSFRAVAFGSTSDAPVLSAYLP